MLSQPQLLEYITLLEDARLPELDGDLREIGRQYGRIDYLRNLRPTSYVAYDYRRREREAFRVIEQRVLRGLRKLERAGIAA